MYANADWPESFVEALMALQSQAGLRADLTRRGHQRSLAYTWPACVSQLQQALKKQKCDFSRLKESGAFLRGDGVG